MRVALSALCVLTTLAASAVPALAESSLMSKWRELFSGSQKVTPPAGERSDSAATPAPDTQPGLARIEDSGGDPRIAWQVVNPFRFFNDARDTERHARAYEWLTDAEKRDPVLNIERKLAKQYPNGWAANMEGATCWDRRRNRHRCPGSGNYIHPKSHTVKAAVLGVVELGNAMCEWQVTTLKRSHRRRKSSGGKVQRVSEPCNTEVKFDIPYPRGANVTVRARGRTIARQIIKVRDVFIVGMGDSFGSGEGNPDRPVRFSDKRTADYGTTGKQVALAGFRHVSATGAKLVMPRLPGPAPSGWTRRVTDRSIRISCARRCNWPSKTRIVPSLLPVWHAPAPRSRRGSFCVTRATNGS